MRVVTPQMKLSVRIDEARMEKDTLILTGVAGMLPCEVTLENREMRRLVSLMPKVALLKALLGLTRHRSA